ncbi:MAG: HNH endonuclease [Anaerolineae bacterium]|nr:HNH endonuclease [Anaerolineae bacterium]
MSISAAQRQTILARAGVCCEYCRVAQDERLSKFQIDHIIPIKHGGSDDTDNLCLACLKCNGFKGPNVAALDPATGEATKLYNPRRQRWDDHFQINTDATLIGISPEGRATIIVLRINEASRTKQRQMAMQLGEYPCKREIPA